MEQEFICICFGNIHLCIRIWTVFSPCICKVNLHIFTVRFYSVERNFLTLIFSRQRIQWISWKFFRIFIIRLRIHIKLQQRHQTFKFITTYRTDRNLKHILVLRQHILLNLHLIMCQRRRQQQAKHQKQIGKHNSDKQYHIITHILEDHAQSKSGKYLNLRTQTDCPLLPASGRKIPAQEFQRR